MGSGNNAINGFRKCPYYSLKRVLFFLVGSSFLIINLLNMVVAPELAKQHDGYSAIRVDLPIQTPPRETVIGAASLFTHSDREVAIMIATMERKLLSGPKLPRLLFLHRHDETNIGDLVSTPQLYFDLFKKVEYTVLDIGDTNQCENQQLLLRTAHQYDAIIVGGGGLFGCVPAWDGTLSLAAMHPASVLWAAGINNVFQSIQLHEAALPEYINHFTLYGLRDDLFLRISPQHMVRQLDDVTCMSPLFDQKAKISRPSVDFIRIAVFEHKQYPINPIIPCSFGNYSSKPDCEAGGFVWDTSSRKNEAFCRFHTTHMSNNGTTSFEEVLTFLANADVVVTSSYHGMWWATLLGKRVVIHQDTVINTKQFLFGYPPMLLTDDLARDIESAKVYDHALDRCRRQSRRFYLEILQILHDGLQRGKLPPPADFLSNFTHDKEECVQLRTPTGARCGAAGARLRKARKPDRKKLRGRPIVEK